MDDVSANDYYPPSLRVLVFFLRPLPILVGVFRTLKTIAPPSSRCPDTLIDPTNSTGSSGSLRSMGSSHIHTNQDQKNKATCLSSLPINDPTSPFYANLRPWSSTQSRTLLKQWVVFALLVAVFRIILVLILPIVRILIIAFHFSHSRANPIPIESLSRYDDLTLKFHIIEVALYFCIWFLPTPDLLKYSPNIPTNKSLAFSEWLYDIIFSQFPSKFDYPTPTPKKFSSKVVQFLRYFSHRFQSLLTPYERKFDFALDQAEFNVGLARMHIKQYTVSLCQSLLFWLSQHEEPYREGDDDHFAFAASGSDLSYDDLSSDLDSSSFISPMSASALATTKTQRQSSQQSLITDSPNHQDLDPLVTLPPPKKTYQGIHAFHRNLKSKKSYPSFSLT